jgi:glyoxylase-like metal-dependent hydrolase (beta-lactamase superfamily II)
MQDQSLIQSETPMAADFRGLHYPTGRWTPEPGALHPVADGVFWLRMPLPFSLNHINLWVLDDGDAWVLVDTGLKARGCKEIWDQLFAGPLADKPVSRILITHFHPDHMGLAGWLAERTAAPLFVTRTEFLIAKTLLLDKRETVPDEVLEFYRRAGWGQDAVDQFSQRGWGNFSKVMSDLPIGFQRLQQGDCLQIGGRTWQVHIGRGHSPEHACLVCPEAGVLISGDQVLPRITPNVSVHATEPGANPLQDWFESLEALRVLSDDLLVLPAHNEPFIGLHARIDQLKRDHEEKLERLLEQCAGRPQVALDCFEVLFRRKVGADDIMMATGEALAHLHYLVAKNMLHKTNKAGVDLYRAV